MHFLFLSLSPISLVLILDFASNNFFHYFVALFFVFLLPFSCIRCLLLLHSKAGSSCCIFYSCISLLMFSTLLLFTFLFFIRFLVCCPPSPPFRIFSRILPPFRVEFSYFSYFVAIFIGQQYRGLIETVSLAPVHFLPPGVCFLLFSYLKSATCSTCCCFYRCLGSTKYSCCCCYCYY